MVRDPLETEDSPEIQPVLDASDDPDCRRNVYRLDEPTTASQISTPCDVPSSTTSADEQLAGIWTEVRKGT